MPTILIVYDEFGPVRVEEQPYNVLSGGWKLVKDVKDSIKSVVEGGQANQIDLSLQLIAKEKAVTDIQQSDRLSQAEKDAYIGLIKDRPYFEIHSYQRVIIFGEWERTHRISESGTPVAPAHTRLIITYVDP